MKKSPIVMRKVLNIQGVGAAVQRSTIADPNSRIANLICCVDLVKVFS